MWKGGKERRSDRGRGIEDRDFPRHSSSLSVPLRSPFHPRRVFLQLSDRRTLCAVPKRVRSLVVDRRYLSSIKDTVEFGPLVISLPSYGFWKHQRPVSLKTKYVSIFKLSLMCRFLPQFESSHHHVMAPFNTSPLSNGWSRTMNTAAAASPAGGGGRPWYDATC